MDGALLLCGAEEMMPGVDLAVMRTLACNPPTPKRKARVFTSAKLSDYCIIEMRRKQYIEKNGKRGGKDMEGERS